MDLARWKSEYPQIENPYFSTVAFDAFIERCGGFRPNTEVLDIGTGIGANLHYFADRHSETTFLGADYNEVKIEQAREIAAARNARQLSFETVDWFALPEGYRGRFDGVMNVHTLCCFKQIEPAIESLTKLGPRWVALNSLFYDGPLDVLIHIRDHTNPSIGDDNPDGDFNTFSLPLVSEIFGRHGYKVQWEPFYPPESLPRPPGGARGTYTATTEWSERSQFSGPVFLPWHFVFASK
ncbi:MAG: class I SAM-dependent methyltransferase [Alphaproteobacteria bacterium]|nr:class I SAM-dependent methyltransferase [Alphaproteobacteria bacterium]